MINGPNNADVKYLPICLVFANDSIMRWRSAFWHRETNFFSLSPSRMMRNFYFSGMPRVAGVIIACWSRASHNSQSHCFKLSSKAWEFPENNHHTSEPSDGLWSIPERRTRIKISQFSNFIFLLFLIVHGFLKWDKQKFFLDFF
jgi:hypothetical protein